MHTKVKLTLIAQGEAFPAELLVPDSYFRPDGTLDERKLRDRLMVNMSVVIRPHQRRENPDAGRDK